MGKVREIRSLSGREDESAEDKTRLKEDRMELVNGGDKGNSDNGTAVIRPIDPRRSDKPVIEPKPEEETEKTRLSEVRQLYVFQGC